MNAVADVKEALKADAVKKLEKDAKVAANAKAAAAKALKGSFSKEVKLIVDPVCASDHWSLVTVLQTGDEAEVKYFDSLWVTDAAHLQPASFLLKELRPDLKPDLEPVNHAKQPAGTAVCGCFVMFWIEQICRQIK
jgi:hypothetical protein